MANKNQTLCNCEGTYNEATGNCDPLLPNSPNPCPDTWYGNLFSWIATNVHIGGNTSGTNTGLAYNPYNVKKDNTAWYILGALVIAGIVWYATKKK